MDFNSVFSLSGKTAAIVGGSKGIGKGIALGFAGAGADVVLISRGQSDLDIAAKEISETTGAKAIGIAADISEVDEIRKLVDKVISEAGKIDILVNSAGVNIRKSCLDYTEDEWDTVQNVQLKSVFFMCQAVAKQMVKKEIKGKIINIASVASTIALNHMIAYCAAKGGVVQMTKALALELAPYSICVNALAPGYISTEMTKPIFNDPVRLAELLSRIPQRRFGEVEDCASLAVYLASDGSDYLTGQLITVDGGWTAS